MCEILIIIVATAIENPSFAAIKGIIGFKKPLYTSANKCAKHSQIIAFFVFCKPFSISILYFKTIYIFKYIELPLYCKFL